MYDYMVGKCPHCSRKFSIQTKAFGESLMKDLTVVSTVESGYGLYELKEGCTRCGKKLYVEIREKKIVAFHKDPNGKKYMVEGLWGIIVTPGTTKDQQFKETMKGLI